jgi:HD-GYP domain-containing protein (c-di-GMP phosphodiesterase class II)
VVEPPTPRDWQLFLSLLVRAGPDERPDRTDSLRAHMAARSVRGIEVEPPAAGTSDLPGEAERREAAKRTYHRSVEVSRELFNGARLGRGARVTEVRQAVQDIVDAVLHNEASLGGLSTLRDYDDYAFTHSVNVCIFCVAIGRRLGLTKAQLYDLGLAALVHDVGMGRIPREILTKKSALTPAEREQMESHTWLGALSAYHLRDYGDIPFRSMVVAYEHHRSAEGAGYPRFTRNRTPSVFARIVAVASAFDAATNERGYHPASPPDAVLRQLWENKSLGHDPVIVKALINLLGIYPVGTCVILDTYELALVHAANSDSAYIHRPIVRLLCDADGKWLSPPPLVDLAATDDRGTFTRSIIKVTSPDRYGIKVSDYFV